MAVAFQRRWGRVSWRFSEQALAAIVLIRGYREIHANDRDDRRV
jgi:hypothetical protein